MTARTSALTITLMGLASWTTSAAAWTQDSGDGLAAAVQKYVGAFGAHDRHQTVVDNRGKGPAELEGVRNLRVVLPGILYRAGGNNAYRRLGALPNSGPLPPEALQNFCKQGFSDAIYLYRKGFTPATITCGARGSENSLRYTSATPFESRATTAAILRLVHDHIEGADHRPILLHCWNGWHASGYQAAIALRQFCGINAQQAVRYWDNNAAPLGAKETKRIHAAIANFTPLPEYSISAKHRGVLCAGL
jgi:hypothetical protein